MTTTRRRGLLMLCFALVCGGLAASQVHERERRAAAAVGPLVPAVVAQRDLPAERRLRPGDVAVKPTRALPPEPVFMVTLRGSSVPVYGVVGSPTIAPSL